MTTGAYVVPWSTHKKSEKILVSVKFVSAILGPKMAARILWAPRKMRSFCRKTYVHKIPRFGAGGVFWVWGGGRGGSADFIFMGAGIFLKDAVAQLLHGQKGKQNCKNSP